MNRAGNQVLSHSTLAAEQNSRVCRCNTLDDSEDLLHSGASGNYVLELVTFSQGLAQAAVLVANPLHVKLFADHQPQFRHGKWLEHVVAGACLHGFHGGLNCSISGHDDDRHRCIRSLGLLQELKAAHPRQFQIGNDEIDRFPLKTLEPGFSVGSGVDSVAILSQADLQQPAHLWLIFDNEDVRHKKQLAVSNWHSTLLATYVVGS